jgi:hypothetical protein
MAQRNSVKGPIWGLTRRQKNLEDGTPPHLDLERSESHHFDFKMASMLSVLYPCKCLVAPSGVGTSCSYWCSCWLQASNPSSSTIVTREEEQETTGNLILDQSSIH